jgi:cytidylate kinase
LKRHPILAIDGPAGTGKTTSASEVARRLGFTYIDSGGLYRAIALAAIERGIADADAPALAPLLADLPVRARLSAERFRVFLGNREITAELRAPEVSSLASKIAVREDVRNRVGIWLRDLARQGPAVIEGRDIGTAVFPDAELKVFLTASLEERARRRALELAAKGMPAPEEEVSRQIAERDERDSGRAVAPLRQAPDAIAVDTTDTDIDGQVRKILEAWDERVAPRIRVPYAFEQFLFRAIARLLWGLRIEGAENVPRHGAVIIASNHKSYFDPLLVGGACRREIHYMAKKELFATRLGGWWMRSSNAIPVARSGFDKHAIEMALAALRGGAGLLVFPEGTRIRRKGLGPAREGIALLAARGNVPIVPVHLKGTWSEERKMIPRSGIRIRFGRPFRLDPLPPGKAGRDRFPEVAARIMAEIAAAGGEESA